MYEFEYFGAATALALLDAGNSLWQAPLFLIGYFYFKLLHRGVDF